MNPAIKFEETKDNNWKTLRIWREPWECSDETFGRFCGFQFSKVRETSERTKSKVQIKLRVNSKETLDISPENLRSLWLELEYVYKKLRTNSDGNQSKI